MNTTLHRIYLIAAFFIFIKIGFSQCEKEISTNYYDPINNEFLPLINKWHPANGPHTNNSFLNNSIRWYSPAGFLDMNFHPIIATGHPQWSNGLGTTDHVMLNPFSTGGTGSPSAAHLILPSPGNPWYRDFWWENGWELLWSNLGRFPNGDPVGNPSPGTYFGNQLPDPLISAPNPPNIPYFALYNRYTGMIRLFSNVFIDEVKPGWTEVSVDMEFNYERATEGNLSGLLRHTGGYDQALDLPTKIYRQETPRSSPTTNNELQLSEFQVGFDPCICLLDDENKHPGILEFHVSRVKEMGINMYSRSVGIDEEITDKTINPDDPNASIQDFLNFAEMHETVPHPGLRMTRNAAGLLSDYENRLEEYEDKLEEYNSTRNQMAKNLIDAGRDLVTGATGAIFPPAAFMSQVSIEKDEDSESSTFLSNSLKGLVGLGYDYAVYSIFGKPVEKPVKPVAPVASFTETSYTGRIITENQQPIPGLYVPGGIINNNVGENFGYGNTDINHFNFPAYNKVLGQVALLESPSVEFHFHNESSVETFNVSSETKRLYLGPPVGSIPTFSNTAKKYLTTSEFSLRITDNIKVALNRLLDFDLSKTKTFINIEVTLIDESKSRLLLPMGPPGLQYFHPDAYVAQYIESSNLLMSHSFETDNDLTLVFNSKWIEYSEANQYLFSIKELLDKEVRQWSFIGPAPYYQFRDNLQDFDGGQLKVKSIKLKLLHDMYFDQIDSYDEQVNTTQVYTYLLYDNENGTAKNVTQLSSPNSLNKYTVGTIHIEDEHITPDHILVSEVTRRHRGTNKRYIYINAEKVKISGELTVEDDCELIIQSLYPINVLEGADIGKNITLRIKKDWFDLEPFTYMDNSEVYNFCNNSNKYKANELDPLPRKRLEKEIAERELKEMLKKEMPIEISIYPNPAEQQITVSKLQREAHALVIYDLKGVVVFSQDVSGKDQTLIDVSNLTGGVYIVSVERENGTVSRKRFVKL